MYTPDLISFFRVRFLYIHLRHPYCFLMGVKLIVSIVFQLINKFRTLIRNQNPHHKWWVLLIFFPTIKRFEMFFFLNDDLVVLRTCDCFIFYEKWELVVVVRELFGSKSRSFYWSRMNIIVLCWPFMASGLSNGGTVQVLCADAGPAP